MQRRQVGVTHRDDQNETAHNNHNTTPSQQQLPSLKEVVPPLFTGSKTCEISTLASPTHSHTSSMPSLREGFDDMTMNPTNEVVYSPYNGQIKEYGDRNSSWSSTSTFSDIPMYPTSTTCGTRAPQMMYPTTTRSTATLPSIRDVPTKFEGTGSYGNVYQISPTQYGGPVPRNENYLNTNANIYGHNATAPSNMDIFSKPPASYDWSAVQTYPPRLPSVRATYNEGFNSYSGIYSPSIYSSTYVPPPGSYLSTENSSLNGRRRRGNLPKHVTDILRQWFHAHLEHPYPSEEDKQEFMRRTGLTISQISNWFINARRRHWPGLREQRRNGRNNSNIVLRRSSSSAGTQH